MAELPYGQAYLCPNFLVAELTYGQAYLWSSLLMAELTYQHLVGGSKCNKNVKGPR